MINYILLAITLVYTAFNVYVMLSGKNYDSGYDKGLEDGIRMTNEVIIEDGTECGRCFGASFGDCDICSDRRRSDG